MDMTESRYVKFTDTRDHTVYIDREGVTAIEEAGADRSSIHTTDGGAITVRGGVDAVMRSLDPAAAVPEWSGA
jgi:hypothetical protein